MARTRAFLGLGANEDDPPARFAGALRRLEAAGVRVAAASRCVRGPYEGQGGSAEAPVWNAVVEVSAPGGAEDLHRLCHDVEAAEGRRRDGRLSRSLDVDLLAYGDERRRDAHLTLPHPDCLGRAFVLAPWEEVAPAFEVPGTGGTVLQHAAALRARRADRFRALEPAGGIDLPPVGADVRRLPDRAALDAWRAERRGSVGVVLTMGALHAGHASLVRRARAACDAVLATIFVNPLQFGPGEDLARYPRTLEADLAVLRAAGADAAYLPAVDDLYPPGFATHVEPPPCARGYEGAVRPGHFRGVATVVAKLWQRTRPDAAWFGRKDAQQVAVLRQVVRDLDLPGALHVAPTVRDAEGLALSSRNRYLSPEERTRALALPRALEEMVLGAARGVGREALAAEARSRMEGAGLVVDYVDVVDPETMTPAEVGPRPALAIAAARAGGTRLLDNRPLVAAEAAGS